MSVEVANVLGAANQIPERVVSLDELEIAVSPPTSTLLARAISAEATLASWPEVVPRTWIPVRVYRNEIPQNIIDAGLYGSYCETFPDIVICSTWNSWREIRLKLLSLIAKLDPDDSGIQAVATIQSLADDICATIPFSIGSRTEPAPLHDTGATYPSIEGQPLPTDHARTAVAVGGWSLWSPLKGIIDVKLYLRSGQQEWVRSQLMRLARIYDVDPR